MPRLASCASKKLLCCVDGQARHLVDYELDGDKGKLTAEANFGRKTEVSTISRSRNERELMFGSGLGPLNPVLFLLKTQETSSLFKTSFHIFFVSRVALTSFILTVQPYTNMHEASRKTRKITKLKVMELINYHIPRTKMEKIYVIQQGDLVLRDKLL